MSVERPFNLRDAVSTFSPTPILVAVSKLLETLSPLLSANSSFDEQTITTLRNLLASLALAAKYVFVALRHSNNALTSICTMLATLKSHRPATLAETLRLIAEKLLFSHANAMDSREVFSVLKTDVERLLRSVMEIHSQETTIRVTGRDTVEHRGLQDLGLSIKKYVEQAETSCASMVDLLSGTNTLIRAFLQDESFSLERPLTDVPLWSPNMFNVWRTFQAMFINFISDLRGPIITHPSWFPEIIKDEKGLIESDEQSRRPEIIQPQFKIIVSQMPGAGVNTAAPTVESVLTDGTIKSGSCEVRLLSIFHTKRGMSTVTVKMSLRQSGIWRHLLKSINLLCRITATNAEASFRVSNHAPATVNDAVADPNFLPKHCRPCFELDTSTSSLTRWHFWRPIYRWRPSSTFPSHFNISFDIEHDTRVGLEFHLAFEYRRRFLPLLTYTEQLVGKPYFVDPPPFSGDPVLSSPDPRQSTAQDGSKIELGPDPNDTTAADVHRQDGKGESA
ncbi:hypothetical protein CVT24_000058 [Panaeolus cyanescens]|uniref:Uncharacterized protein n=1 Tax=Panaeolus cyanescens TaxID=181874 RepID=A0A409VWH6_9AGAR|nr:hypothetical protein CVT24_000058 [Panaeolus cyanescens]